MPPTPDTPSTRPYLLRALHAWCTDNGFTPYVAVHVDGSVQVPMEYVDNHEIVLNIGHEATAGLKIGNDYLEFRARFRGVSREIQVPIDHVVAIYARENGQGMAFPMPTDAARAEGANEAPASPRGLRLASTEPDAPPAPGDAATTPGDEPPDPAPAPGNRPSLKRIK
ncbi:ClpXP protease specificity-enhancing factor [Rubrivivax sp. A210]|uniref:ClpXP protease specificity-enhancing factor n=1 Tax=Rubrivivax sp. A210 TaxID=2772301 RepID=UPI00191B7D36|nr:ClpXP protease specificity-enhancing factor [Rubrivivax sp. A210]CAD5369234.1 ClpXP protease specificity-enhancing factor [Rubrivivax sp. A210]